MNEEFVIESGILKKYNGSGSEVIIPEDVIGIDDNSFFDCEQVTIITIPQSVNSISGHAFFECNNLEGIIIPQHLFDDKFVKYSSIHTCKNLSWIIVKRDPDKDLILAHASSLSKGSTLFDWGTAGFWKGYDNDLIANNGEIKYGKTARIIGAIGRLLNPDKLTKKSRQEYVKLLSKNIKQAIQIADRIKRQDFIDLLFYEKVIDKSNNAKTIELLKNSKNLEFTAIGEQLHFDGARSSKESSNPKQTTSKKESAVEKLCVQRITEAGSTVNDIENRLATLYALSAKDLPGLKDKEGKKLSSIVLTWLLQAHETTAHWDESWVVPSYEKPEIYPEAAEIVEYLDKEFFQSVLLKLADDYIDQHRSAPKKRFLSYPICRYADEGLMNKLINRAKKWSESSKYVFDDAVLYNNTFPSMVYADRIEKLDKYAYKRGMEEDMFRDRFLSDVGLDSEGCKSYDLGMHTVTIRLQRDFSFLVEMPDTGKNGKSLPKKEADIEKWEAANIDFSKIKKSVKKIVKNRGSALFKEFLEEKERPVDDWKNVYLANPVLRILASLLVWKQETVFFTLMDTDTIDAEGERISLGEESICLAHPMEMNSEDILKWQKYFLQNGLKQPFVQIWEPVIDKDSINPDRYTGIDLPMMKFSNMETHGISAIDLHAYSEEFYVTFKDCQLVLKPSSGRLNPYSMDEYTFTLGEFSFEKYTRYTNHIVGLLDKWTVEAKILKDDVSVINQMDAFTLSQIIGFITLAAQNECTNVTAALLKYREKHYSDYGTVDSLLLD